MHRRKRDVRVANMRFEYIDSLKNAMDAIDSIGTVEPCAESARV